MGHKWRYSHCLKRVRAVHQMRKNSRLCLGTTYNEGVRGCRTCPGWGLMQSKEESEWEPIYTLVFLAIILGILNQMPEILLQLP